jgi:hypothetical protein
MTTHGTTSTPPPPVDFSTFILGLASTAFIQMGATPDPSGEPAELNLVMARQTIDIVGLLREKTRGNLTDEEQKLLDALLYDLRLQYVEAQKKVV